MRNRATDRGQVLVIVAISILALVGFVALAIDGGNIFAERRQAQAASDTAAMSAALAILSGYEPGQVEQVALLKAEDNGYQHNPPGSNVIVNWPPASPHPYAGNSNYVQVIITSQVNSFFAHIFYAGPLEQTVQSVAHVSINEDLLPGYAVYGNNPSACPSVEFDGSPITNVSGGGSILSNSLADCSCGANGGAGVSRGSGEVVIDDPTRAGIYSAGCWGEYGSSFTSVPSPVGDAGQEYIDPIPTPDCSALPDHTGEGDKVINGTAVLTP
ncbi:MAG: pilus assembly protein TadG-related protein, partial [Anaerolineales bacterium]